MQLLIERLLIAVLGAVLIIVSLLLLGVSIGYRDEFKRRNIDIYARIITGVFLSIITVYLYLSENFDSDILFIGIIWVLPVLLCTDWKGLRDNANENIEDIS